MLDAHVDGSPQPALSQGPQEVLAGEARQMAESIPDGLLMVDHRGRIAFASARLLSMTGYAPSDLVGAPVEVLLPSVQRPAHARHRRAFGANPAHRPSGTGKAFAVRRADGTVFPADIALNPVRWAGHEVVLALVSDLTPRRRAEDLRSMQFAVTRILSEAVSLEEAGPPLLEAVARGLGMDAAQLWTAAREASARRFSWNRSGRVWPKALRDLPPALSFAVFDQGSVAAVFDLFSRTQPQPEPDVHELVRDIRDQIGHFVERRRAQADLEESHARLAEVAATDPLTGLRNRREYDRLAMTIPRRRFGVLVIDVDNLKQINDEYGHEAGDVALRAVSSTLTSVLRGWDTVARTGGDEFSVLMPDVTAGETARAAERVRAAVSATSVPQGQVRISIGWAAAPAGAEPRTVGDLADAHLYEAKRGGRDRVVGSSLGRPGSPAARRSEWSTRIDRALADRDLTILFQPISRLDDGSVVGHEALARPPGFGPTDSVEDMFAEAHRTGRIRDLDWLCRRLAIAAVPWPVAPAWALFLNVSAAPLLDPVHGVDQLLMLLEEAGGRPDQVVLEITERERVSDLGRVREVLADYRSHGFRFALDDVGEGHSTLELLVAAAPEYIKLARSLTMTGSHSSSRAAIRAAIAFAQASGAEVVAEGIETEFAAHQMAGMGVALGQGMWLGHPRSLEPGTELLGRARNALRPRPALP